MKTFLLILAVAGLAWCQDPTSSPEDHLEDDLHGQIDENALFGKFVSKFARSYKSADERKARFSAFSESLKELLELAKTAQGNVKFGLTDFMDWTKEEKANFVIQKGKENKPALNQTSNDPNPKMPNIASRGGGSRRKRQLPANFDWRSYGVVSSVKNQGNCGSCWAHAAVAAIESQKALWYGYLPDLSEQDLVDCDTTDSGCSGGWPQNAMQWTMQNGITTEASYPYVAYQEGACKVGNSALTKINSWYYTGTTEASAANWLYSYGPLTHAIWVPNSFYYYTSGVYHPSTTECSSPVGGHAMAVVGFGVDNGIPYWLIKNSWGAGWGLSGYIKFYRGDWSCSMGYQMALPYQ